MTAIPLSMFGSGTNSQLQIPALVLASAFHPCSLPTKNKNSSLFGIQKTLFPSTDFLCSLKMKSISDSSANIDTGSSSLDEPGISGSSLSTVPPIFSGDDVDIEIKIEKLGNNSRRIQSRIAIHASLETIWNLLTDYERLADFIPGLAVSQLLEKRENFARVFQIGQQNLAFGLKFNAKGVVDCFEKDLERHPFGQRRDIEFEMIEGDFKTFRGKWSIEQVWMNDRSCQLDSVKKDFRFWTTLSYEVDVEPKLWLPVRIVEARLCNEIKVNLTCIQQEAQKTVLRTDSPIC